MEGMARRKEKEKEKVKSRRRGKENQKKKGKRLKVLKSWNNVAFSAVPFHSLAFALSVSLTLI